VALAGGLLLGAALKPDLASEERPIGPQIFIGWSAARATPPPAEAEPEAAAYSGPVPDYVYGTDLKRPIEMVEAAALRASLPPPQADAGAPSAEPDGPPVVVSPDEDADRAGGMASEAG
jgi:hypothetical protein